MRKQLVNMAGTNMAVNFDDFFVPYTTTLSLNWPYPKEKVLISNNANNGDDQQMLDVGINPVFEVHLRELTNWSLGTKFKAAFPDLVQNVRLVDHPVSESNR